MNSLAVGADPQLNNTAASALASSGGGGSASTEATIFTVDQVLNLGPRARLVALSDGLAIEVMDGSGNWVRETAWNES